MQERVEGYDLIRAFAIFTVFVGHVLDARAVNPVLLLASRSLSPGLTMALLGFTSAALLATRSGEAGAFLIRRFARVYLSLWLCLAIVLAMHAYLGKDVLSQHTLLHLMGLSAFLDLLAVRNVATVGTGLWFVTTIVAMYLLLPLLVRLLGHRRGLAHLVLLIAGCTALDFLMYGAASIWNVVIAFSLGVYLAVNGRLESLIRARLSRALPFAALVTVVVVLSTAEAIPYAVRRLLFACYPIAFIPLFFRLSTWLPKPGRQAIRFFALASYEFYLLHFYFIGRGLRELLPWRVDLAGEIAISCVLTFALAWATAGVASRLGTALNRYLLPSSASVQVQAEPAAIRG